MLGPDEHVRIEQATPTAAEEMDELDRRRPQLKKSKSWADGLAPPPPPVPKLAIPIRPKSSSSRRIEPSQDSSSAGESEWAGRLFLNARMLSSTATILQVIHHPKLRRFSYSLLRVCVCVWVFVCLCTSDVFQDCARKKPKKVCCRPGCDI